MNDAVKEYSQITPAFPTAGFRGMSYRQWMIGQVAAGGWNEVYHGLAIAMSKSSNYGPEIIAQVYAAIADQLIAREARPKDTPQP